VNCKLSGDITPLQRFSAQFAEQLGPDVHHHHTVFCEDCGGEWFDDAVIGPLGILVPSRRDSVMCPCPADGRVSFTPNIVLVRVSEARCRCTIADFSRARAL
jgi:hypothetical protein